MMRHVVRGRHVADSVRPWAVLEGGLLVMPERFWQCGSYGVQKLLGAFRLLRRWARGGVIGRFDRSRRGSGRRRRCLTDFSP